MELILLYKLSKAVCLNYIIKFVKLRTRYKSNLIRCKISKLSFELDSQDQISLFMFNLWVRKKIMFFKKCKNHVLCQGNGGKVISKMQNPQIRPLKSKISLHATL